MPLRTTRSVPVRSLDPSRRRIASSFERFCNWRGAGTRPTGGRESWFRPCAELSADSSTLILRSGAGVVVPKRPLLLSEKRPDRVACRYAGGAVSEHCGFLLAEESGVRMLATTQGSVESSCENRGSEVRSDAAKNRGGWTTRAKSCVETARSAFAGGRIYVRSCLASRPETEVGAATGASAQTIG